MTIEDIKEELSLLTMRQIMWISKKKKGDV
jgi:hypothetical protein